MPLLRTHRAFGSVSYFQTAHGAEQDRVGLLREFQRAFRQRVTRRSS